MNKNQNEKGEIALYDQGNLIGYAPVILIGGVKVLTSMQSKLAGLISAAQADGVNLTLAAGLRTWDEQFKLRKQNVIDKSKSEDIEYLNTAPSNSFSPATGKPGWSNHQDGKAYDFNVSGKKYCYMWLVENAHKFGFVRTVPSERWHWEHIPGADRFTYVLKTDPTWDGLIK